MLYSHLVSFGCLFALTAHAQSSDSSSSSSSSSSADDLTVLTGISENATPTGSYISYSSTSTLQSSSALTTSALVSTVTTGSTTRTTTRGSTTIFGINGTPIMGSNATATRNSTSTSSDSRVLLQGSAPTASMNGTNSTRTSTTIQPTNTTPCNNHAEFCYRSYSNITEVAAHNSPFVKAGNAAANQALGVTTQLNDGVRLLQGQMHFVGDVPHFCHGSCSVLDSGPITDYLGEVYEWVLSHPFDVVTILLGNGAYNAVTTYVPFIESSGLSQFAYIPSQVPMGIDDWPTLASMILTGKRIVFFMDYEANQAEVPWILDEFSQMWETPFDPTDRDFPCTVQRPPDLSVEQVQNRLYLMNHNLNYNINLLGNSILVPQVPLLNVTNNVTGYGSLGEGARNCTQTHGYPPKFLNVDYYNVGDGSVFEVAARYNNVTYDRECCGQAISAGEKTLEITGRGAILIAMCAVGVSWQLL